MTAMGVLAEVKLEVVFTLASGSLYPSTGPTAQIWQGQPESGSVARAACLSTLARVGSWLA